MVYINRYNCSMLIYCNTSMENINETNGKNFIILEIIKLSNKFINTHVEMTGTFKS